MGLLDGSYSGSSKPDWRSVFGRQSPRRVVFRIVLIVIVLLVAVWRFTRG